MLSIKQIFKTKIKLLYVVLVFNLIIFCPTQSICFAADESNFFDFVREQRRRELPQDDENQNSSVKTGNNSVLFLFGQCASVLITISGAAFIFYTSKKYKKPYVSDINVEFDDKAVERFVESISPVEVSAIININNFSKYDLIAVFFDLIRRGIIFVEQDMPEDFSALKIYLNNELFANSTDVENYEDFFVGWFFKKIGGGEYFSFRALREYIALDSRAAEFDIDYDIWIEELNEYVEDMDIKDNITEKWKYNCAILSVTFSIAGLILLYLTNSALSIMPFFVAVISYKASYNAQRRSEASENVCKVLQVFKTIMDSNAKNNVGIDDDNKWCKYFVYSISLNNTATILDKYKKYESLYYALESELDKAIMIANNAVSKK